MKFWIDAQLSPALAPWLEETFAVEAYSIKAQMRKILRQTFRRALRLLQAGEPLVEITDTALD